MAANAQDVARKKSPRAPSIPLDEALDKVLRIYDKERIHAAPPDLVAQAMGYKDANNGRALAALASLRYYGLIDRVNDGKVAVSKDVEAFKFAPSEDLRLSYLRKFLASPPLFAELLDRYGEGLPSDGSLRYDLIQRGFLPASAEVIVGAFRRSVDYARVFEREPEAEAAQNESEPAVESRAASQPAQPAATPAAAAAAAAAALIAPNPAHPPVEDSNYDRIPVRLAGGRRAWLLIPPAFYEADKQRLKAQIDLLLTEDE